jgi:hypothetical protein
VLVVGKLTISCSLLIVPVLVIDFLLCALSSVDFGTISEELALVRLAVLP